MRAQNLPMAKSSSSSPVVKSPFKDAIVKKIGTK